MDLNSLSWTDANADGVGDTGYADTNADGFYDFAAVDSNFDGYVEGYSWDTDGNGVFDTVSVDSDLDGYLDSHGWDITGDGVMDLIAGPETGGAAIDVTSPSSSLGQDSLAVGPSTATSPQADLAELYGYTNDPFTKFLILDTLDSMNDSVSIWTSPNYYYW